MKTSRIQILILSLLALVMSGFSATAEQAGPAPEPMFEDEWEAPDQWRPPEEAIDRMLERIKETDPEAAERLAKLREDPEKFGEELGKYMREHWKDMHRGDRSRHKWRGRQGGRGDRGGYWGRERMWKRHQEFVEWFSENYPEDANELEAIRQTNPRLYMRKMMRCVKKYGKIAETAKNNPELSEVMKENVELKDKRDEILKELRTAEGDEKDALAKKLAEIVSERFDLIVRRKQLQHEQLLKKLARLEEQVKESEGEVDKWKTSKDQKVKERVDELLGKSDEFHWD